MVLFKRDICEDFGSPAVKYIKLQTSIIQKKFSQSFSKSPSWKTFFVSLRIGSFFVFQNGTMLQKNGCPPSISLTTIFNFIL